MPLGQLLGALGRFLAGLGRFLNAFLLPGIPRASILEGLGAGRAWFWKASGTYFGMRFAAPRTLKPNACIHAVTTFFSFPSALHSFASGAAVCAQHMEFESFIEKSKRKRTKTNRNENEHKKKKTKTKQPLYVLGFFV